jgi:hypothetical protein
MQPPGKQDESGERIASFVFLGTVLAPGATTEPSMQGKDTAVLKVERILYASEALQKFTGLQLTLQQAGGLKQGQQAVFFTDVLIYGTSLVVQEVEPRVEAVDAMQGRLLPPERHLQQRIRAADLIVQGRVLSVENMQAPNGPLSEHDPLWAKAKVGVQSVLKGDFQGHEVEVVFPRSIDHLWYKAPKFQAGQWGTWLLRFAEITKNERAYTALDPIDFQTEENTNRVAALLEM